MLHLLQKNLRFFAIFVFPVISANTPEHLYKTKGGDVVLHPHHSAPSITSIEWKHGSDLAAEWDGDGITYFRHFQGRCSLNLSTGALTITGLNGNDTGYYSAQINHKQISTQTQLSVISQVNKPFIYKWCNPGTTYCTLTCEGETPDAEPIRYKWFVDGAEGPSVEEIDIRKDTEGESFSCMLLNPVSNKSSDSFKNRISAPEHLYKTKGGDVVLHPHYPAPSITSIVWKHGSDLAAERDGNSITCLGQFKGRCSLNLSTGALTITGLNGNDNGYYSAQINKKQISTQTQLSVISQVNKPSIYEWCDYEIPYCTLTCEGQTPDAEPIRYKWFVDGAEGPSVQEIDIREDTEGESFFCMLLNPVSNKSSDSVSNPISSYKRNKFRPIILVTAFGLAVLLILLIDGLRRNHTRIRREQERRKRYKKIREMLQNRDLQQPDVPHVSEVQQEPNHNGSAPAVIHDGVGGSAVSGTHRVQIERPEPPEPQTNGNSSEEEPLMRESVNTSEETKNSAVTSDNHEPTNQQPDEGGKGGGEEDGGGEGGGGGGEEDGV